jgi:CheY-like chemotaxis protein
MNPSHHVLIAEDTPEDIEIYEMALTRLGFHNYEIVRDGQEVIRYLRAEDQYADRKKHPFPNWLLIDLKMPRVDGLQVLQWLRHNDKCSVTPVVMFSNSDQEKDITEAYRLGVNAYFTKPTKIQELVEALSLVHHFWTIAKCPVTNPELKCV